MKNQILAFLTLLCLLSGCGDDNDLTSLSSSPSGVWILKEVLSDPGDGSGTFRPVESTHSILIFEDNSFKSSEDICNGSDNGVSGQVDVASGRFRITDCFNGIGRGTLRYQQVKDEMILYFLCIEPCAQKYVRIAGTEGIKD
ncbi:MAG: hypothetical protein AAFO69_02380 [Bacteroidota bacterium]